jgi:matrixin
LRVAGGLLWVVAIAATVARVFVPSGWTRAPAVTVVSAPDDPRIPTVREAVAFWNQTFADLGTPFRLGAITLVEGSVPGSDMRELSETVLHHRLSLTLPASTAQFPGDILVVLSDANFISFTARRSQRTLVGIKNGPLLNAPNVLRNVVAHELGHAIGLPHDDDPKLLMCGRPAPCRPDAYQSDNPHFFPLSAVDKDRLRSLYPPSWVAR